MGKVANGVPYGNNPLNRCYIVGYSDISVKFPHHRAASGLSKCEDPDPHKYVLYGALVGGPDENDQHIDMTSDWVYNEVTIDYNAAFVGACAGLYRYFGILQWRLHLISRRRSRYRTLTTEVPIG